MITENYDGHPIQSGSRTGRLTGEVPEFSIAGITEGVVVARYFINQPGNRTRTCTEYDVRDIGSGQTIPNCRPLQSLFGLKNGGESPYHPASQGLSANIKFNKNTKALDTDGDIVVVGFLGGSRQNAVIFGALPNGSTAYATTAEQGERRFIVHNETTVQIGSDGSFQLARKGTTVAVDTEGVVSIKADKIFAGSDLDSTTNASGVGDSIKTNLAVLVAALLPYFLPRPGATPPPPTVSVPGEITSGSSSVNITKG